MFLKINQNQFNSKKDYRPKPMLFTSKNQISNRIIVLVPFRNVGNYIIDCVSSILGQEYNNYEVYLLDDASDDGTIELIDDDLPNFYKRINNSRIGALENIYQALVTESFLDEDIIIILDGDDYIFGEFAFQIVNSKYHDDALLTYGSYITNYGFYDPSSPYTEEEFNMLRQTTWKASHLKTFKYKLFKAFLDQDPNVENFRYSDDRYGDNRFYMSTYDQALMLPLLEIAGFENCLFIQNVIYCYRLHKDNDHATDEGRKLQLEAFYDIRSRPPLNRKF
ncbi:glycosyltransferase family A protein [Sphingobacterium zeae]|uniref:Glycosyltransferase involved in cell wall biosynthesis n=1 Tax=Sphingobacterium zeae TaxID=1776859 RepID=A0ABU0U2U2_9SPHI|nr:glycosyltransferase family A protein [Sphingobacterium zeae]MDQ1149273.1 glycosyltransferase involved in cell wall biosynthesis [Sphingobacterium zeae]